jgi:hypothetical protein
MPTNKQKLLQLALFFELIDLWLAFYITMAYVTVRSPVDSETNCMVLTGNRCFYTVPGAP